MSASWVPEGELPGFGIDHLPFGVFGPARHIGVAIEDHILDLTEGASDGLIDDPGGELGATELNPLMAAGPIRWASLRERVTEILVDESHRDRVTLVKRQGAQLHLPWRVADYVDFYSSLEHATNLGRMFRPDGEPLLPNWRHLPVAYHGRSGTVVVSGTEIRRPKGQTRPGQPGETPPFGPSRRLDIEAEVGFVVGVGSEIGTSVSPDAFSEHVFGVCLVNDWSARDIQAWEYVPLGPFLGKSFATSVAGWITPLAALPGARTTPPPQHPPPLDYLRDDEPWGLDLALEVRLNGTLISSPPFGEIYWTPGQQLAQMTINGASLSTGDLYASGTVSGNEPHQRGSLIELTWNGETSLTLENGEERTFLEDGDEVVISATAPSNSGDRIALGEVRGVIVP
ncbi:MAG: fumarylacetoacetase [Acidimicrobiia bacterium]|nr:fumarylacetoacetase [Acidimicrobiia bacterium]